VKERTSSVWDYFLCRKAEFANPDFDPTIDDHVKGRERILLPRLKEIRWWHQLFGRTEDEMNAALNAAAAAENDRQAAVSSLQYPSVIQSEDSAGSGSAAKQPPSLTQSQSVLTAVETAHATLTPEDRQSSLRRSASAEGSNGSNAFSTIRDGIASLNFGKSVLGNIRRSEDASTQPSSSADTTISRSDQELREMA
jgi:hypothetical protein